jgi:hypothetical protein
MYPKTMTHFIAALLIVSLTAVPAAARPLRDLVVKSNGYEIQVWASPELIGAWLGCTVGQDLDLPAQRITAARYVTFVVPRSARFSGEEFVCAAWEDRVSHCGCLWCEKNG